MKTSGLAGKAGSDGAAQRRLVGARYPIGAAIGPPELGAGEQFGKSRVVASGNQAQPVDHAADRGTAGGQRFALADVAGNAQGRLVDGLEEAEAGTGLGRQFEQRDGAEFGVDDASGDRKSTRLKS